MRTSPLPVLFPSVGSIPKSRSSYFKENPYFVNNQQNKYILKHSGFSQAIHFFFSSKKNVNRLEEICIPLENDFVLFRQASFPSRGSGNVFRFGTANF